MRKAVRYVLERARSPFSFERESVRSLTLLKSPGMAVEAYVDAVKNRPMKDGLRTFESCLGNLSKYGREVPKQAKALLSVVGGSLYHFRPICVAPRTDANGKHVLLKGRGDHVTEYVRWTLRGAHVTSLYPENVEIGDWLDSFPETQFESVRGSADMIREVRLFSDTESPIDIPNILENLRFVRPLVEEKLKFDLNSEPAIELLDFLDTKQSSIAEATVHEFLELCQALEGEAIAGRPVELILDAQAPLLDHIVVHAVIAALNPFRKSSGKDTVVLLNPGDNIHDSVKRFVNFATSRLGFAWSLETAGTDDYLKVAGMTAEVEGLRSADGDPFRLGAQHLVQADQAGEFTKRDFEIVSCKRPNDDSVG